MFTKSLRSGLLVLIASAVTVWAASPGAFEGTVKDATGRPVKGAELHLVAKDPSIPERITKTDAAGHYGFMNVQSGTYQMILFVDRSIKANINNAKTQMGSPTQLNFDLKTTSVAKQAPKKGTHMVYVPAETGSHLGGRWVEVDDNGNINAASTNNVQKTGGDAIRGLQNSTGGGTSTMGGGH